MPHPGVSRLVCTPDSGASDEHIPAMQLLSWSRVALVAAIFPAVALVAATFPAVASGRALSPTMVPDEVLVYRTADGWNNEIRHYQGDGPPVVLVHGLGANHHNFDFRPEVSLARTLQEEGWDVWIPELRGDPGTTAPSRRARRSYDFDDYVDQDLPAALDLIQDQTGARQVHWVGHSMGGMLLYAALDRYPERVSAGVTVCSSAVFSEPSGIHRVVQRAHWLIEGRGRVPFRALANTTRVLGRANPVIRRVANRDNLDRPLLRGLARHALNDLSLPLVAQGSQWLHAGVLVDRAGEPFVVEVEVPVLVLGGAADQVIDADDAATTCEALPACTYQLLGTEGGMSTDYGHVDSLLGLSSAAEVYPVIAGFLRDQRT